MIITLLLKDITVDSSLQPRVAGLDTSHIRSLEETPEAWPPVTVVQQGNKYLLLDGFHRLAAAQNLELETLAAEVAEAQADTDLATLAFQLNLKHGRPLSLQDRRAFASHILYTRPELSDRAIGEMAALSGNTVTAIRRELESRAQIERPAERVGRGGYVYTEPERQPGELPARGLGTSLADAAARLFSGPERAKQRNWAMYLEHLADALEDRFSLPNWEGAEATEIAEACRRVLGDEKANELANDLHSGATDLLEVAVQLGGGQEDNG